MASQQERIVKVIAEQLGFDDAMVTPDKSLVADLGADSLDEIELVVALEDEFGIEIPDYAAWRPATVQGVFDLIASLCPERA